jgi:hypothetical protein
LELDLIIGSKPPPPETFKALPGNLIFVMQTYFDPTRKTTSNKKWKTTSKKKWKTSSKKRKNGRQPNLFLKN